MRIGIDARMYGPTQGGLGRYIQQLILNLEKTTSKDDFVIFLRFENWHEYTPANPRFTKIAADIPWYGWKEQVLFKKIIKQQKVNLMHFPHWNVPLTYNDPFVVTIHDLLLLHYPTRRASTLGPLVYWFKNWMFKKVLNHAAKKSRSIIATSEYTKKDLITTLDVPAAKIHVTYQAPTELPDKPTVGLLQQYGITKPFVIYIGVAYPHKNLPQLVKAWGEFKKTYQTKEQLVLVGKQNYFYNQLLESAEWKNSPDVHYAGFVPDEHLPELYRQAALYVMPSLHEGYALPTLEALSFDLPIISSEATCLPEVLGDAALYFDPNNPKAIAETLHQGLTDQKKRAELQENGRKIRQKYSGTVLAQKTLALYQKNSG